MRATVKAAMRSSRVQSAVIERARGGLRATGADAGDRRAEKGLPGVRRECERPVAEPGDRSADEEEPLAPEAVGERARRRRAENAHRHDRRHDQARGREREAAPVVEVDQLERQHEAEAEEVDDVAELDDPDSAREVRLALAEKRDETHHLHSGERRAGDSIANAHTAPPNRDNCRAGARHRRRVPGPVTGARHTCLAPWLRSHRRSPGRLMRTPDGAHWNSRFPGAPDFGQESR